MAKEIFEKARELSNLLHQDENLKIFGKENKISTVIEEIMNYETREKIYGIANLRREISPQEKAYVNTLYRLIQKAKDI